MIRVLEASRRVSSLLIFGLSQEGESWDSLICNQVRQKLWVTWGPTTYHWHLKWGAEGAGCLMGLSPSPTESVLTPANVRVEVNCRILGRCHKQLSGVGKKNLCEWSQKCCEYGGSMRVKEKHRMSFSFPFPFYYVRTHHSLWTRERALTRAKPRWCLDLRLPDSRTVKNKLMLFISHTVFRISL